MGTLSRELVVWLVLRRVQGGGVTKVGRAWLDGGRPTPGYLPGAIEELLAAGLVVLADPDPLTEATRRVGLTEDGRARYTALALRRPARDRWAARMGLGCAPAPQAVVVGPGGEQIAALAGAIRASDLNAQQGELVARLLEEIDTWVRMAPRGGQLLCPQTAQEWASRAWGRVVGAYRELWW